MSERETGDLPYLVAIRQIAIVYPFHIEYDMDITKGDMSMLYLLAILLPPVAVLLVGKPVQALVNVLLCMLFVIPGVIHAVFVVHEHKADQRMKKQVELMKQ